MKNFKFLQTDFYQISMGFAYVVAGLNTQKTGFEGFVRHVKPAINPNKNFYIFDGETQVREYIDTIRTELKDPELVETFIELIEPKITAPNKAELIQKFRDNWKTVDTDFEYSVAPNGSVVFPFVPVFQYSGDKMIGQMIETYVTNIYNGRTGLATLKYMLDNGIDVVEVDDFEWLSSVMENNPAALDVYADMLSEDAKKFRESTDKILLEAAFRRAPSFETAKLASKIAIECGWNGTSNVAPLLNGELDASKIGGTMAHSWVMCFKDEGEAFRVWDKIFPGTTMLIDTYNVENAARTIKTLVDSGEIVPPKEVRIDSDPLDAYAKMVDEIFEGKVNIYVSGDMTVDRFNEFKDAQVPYSKAMAGTKYVYADDVVAKLNSGFVYKIVQYTDENSNIVKPEKKAAGKSNYAGLKTVVFDKVSNTLVVNYSKQNNEIGFFNVSEAGTDAKVLFI